MVYLYLFNNLNYNLDNVIFQLLKYIKLKLK